MVDHDSPYFRVEGLRFLPRPVQQPRIPIWVATQSSHRAPLRRAARYDGCCPEAKPADLARMLETIGEFRGNLDDFEVALAGTADRDPDEYRAAGATWWLVQLPEISTRSQASAVAIAAERLIGGLR